MLGADRPPEALGHLTGFLMGWCAERSRALFAQRVGEIGLHPREFGLLNVLDSNAGATQQQLGELVGIDPSTMVLTVDALEARGLAVRRPHPDDRRRRAVELTDAGREALTRGRAIAAETGDELFARLSKAEREQLHKLLRKLSGLDS